MAKFTVFFKDKAIHSAEFGSGVIHIGSDETNDLVINSLAVAPIHAAVVIRDDGSAIIKQLSDNFPLIVNGLVTKGSGLRDNDVLTVGKHTIVYQASHIDNSAPLRGFLSSNESLIDDDDERATETSKEMTPRIATLQVTSGKSIGKIMTIKNPMTRLGTMGSGVAVITKRQSGYFISVLENIGTITVNNKPLGENTIKLSPGDMITVNKASMQFFY